MKQPYEQPEPIEVVFLGEYDSRNAQTLAYWYWPGWKEEPRELGSDDSYTIAPNNSLSVRFSGDKAIRPLHVILRDEGVSESVKTLNGIGGEKFASTMLEAPRSGSMFVIRAALGLENRLFIAEMQFNSPSTPPHIRNGCRAFIDGNSVPAPTPPPPSVEVQ